MNKTNRHSSHWAMLSKPFSVLNVIQVCIHRMNATDMECLAPVFPGDETEKGEISFDMDGAHGLLRRPFEYHPDGDPIPFESDGNILSLSPGQTEVSLHVGGSHCQSCRGYNQEMVTSCSQPYQSTWWFILIWRFHIVLKLENNFVHVLQQKKLSLVNSCMDIRMTIGAVACNVQVLENELTCRIPKDLIIPSEGLPVMVRNYTL